MRYELKIPNTFSENDSVIYKLDSILETSLLHKVQTYILIVDMSCLFPHLKLMRLLLHLHTHIRAFEDCHIPKRLQDGFSKFTQFNCFIGQKIAPIHAKT